MPKHLYDLNPHLRPKAQKEKIEKEVSSSLKQKTKKPKKKKNNG